MFNNRPTWSLQEPKDEKLITAVDACKYTVVVTFN